MTRSILEYYITLHFSIAIGVLIHGYGISLGTVHAARLLHSKLFRSILHAPMSFFDTTPIGRSSANIVTCQGGGISNVST